MTALNEQLQLSTLPNGLRVVTTAMPHAGSVAISVGVGVGARHEQLAQHGLSHFLEHMAFKGTPTRNALEIAESFDAIGGNLNAYTSMEQTVYYARVLKKDAGFALELLADILQHSSFDEEELARERMVILQEIAMHHDTPDDLIFDRFTEVAFPNQAIGRSILGTDASVSSFTQKHLREYVATHYHPSRMVVSIAGDVEHDAMVREVEALFSGVRAEQAQDASEAGQYQGGEERMEKPLEQVHLLLGYPTVSYQDEGFRAAQLMASILGGGMSSRLFQEVREKRGLAYSVYAFVNSYIDCGWFGIYTGTGEEESRDILPLLANELARLPKDVSEVELDRARNQMIANVVMAAENVASQSEIGARHVLSYGRVKSTKEVIAELEAVRLSDIQQAVRTMLAAPPTLCAIGPLASLPALDTVRERLVVN